MRSIPVVNDLEPVWTDARLREDVEAGRYFLPGTATGARETLITSSSRAEPQYVQVMPGLSWWPLLAALFTAGFFLLLTVKALTLSAICGVLTIVCLMCWVWGNDRHLPQKQVDAGAGILLPTYVAGPQLHGWWAAVLLVIVLGMIYLMALFAYFYQFGAHSDWWKLAAPRGALLPGLLLLGASAGLAWAARPLMARLKRGSGASAATMTLSMVCLVAAMAVDSLDWWHAGLRGNASGQGATVYAMLAWHGTIVVAVVLSAFYYLARWMRGLAPGPANKTLEALRILFMYAALKGGGRPAAAAPAALGQRVKALTHSNGKSSGRPIVTAFVIWFVHFMMLWAAGEVWPQQWAANALAWAVTAIALLVMGVHHDRLKALYADGDLPGWSHRFARGAAAISTVAVVFTVLPSVVFSP